MKRSLIFLMLLLRVTVSAQQIRTVTNLNDAGPGSLRNEVLNSNAGDTVEFNSSLIANGSDTLKLYFPVIFNHVLTVRGQYSGSDTLYISGQDSTQIFFMDFSTSLDPEMYLEDLAIIEGKQFSNDPFVYNTNGGAIMAWGLSKLVLEDVVIRDCRTTGNGRGGAMYVRECDSVILTRSRFERNHTDSTASQSGGWARAIRMEYGSVSMEECHFIGNYCAGRGGAIVTLFANLEALDCSFVLNTTGIGDPLWMSQTGGALFYTGSDTGACSFERCKFIGNHAESDAGTMYLTGGGGTSPSYAKLYIKDCLFENNESFRDGGALRISQLDVHAWNTSFIDNTSGRDGGVLNMSIGSLSLNNTSFTGNDAVIGTVIYMIGSAGSIYNTTMTSNGALGSTLVYITSALPDTIEVRGSILSMDVQQATHNNSSYWISSGFNIFSDAPSFAHSSDQVNVNSVALGLEPITNNGGTTPTMLPGPNSVTLNAGDTTDFSLAQNGPIFGFRDIGAAERPLIIYDTTLVCGTINWWGGTYDMPGTYTDTLHNSNSIDSVGILYLYAQDTSVVNVNATLVALEQNPGTSYQWVNCDSAYAPVTGATDSIFQPTVNGNYAVVLINGNCSDTSACINYNEVGLTDGRMAGMPDLWVRFYPNPATNYLHLQTDGDLPQEFVVLDLSGRVVCRTRIQSETIELPELSSGIYLLQWIGENGQIQVDRVVVR